MYVAFEIECKVFRDYILLIRLDINQKYLRSLAVSQLRRHWSLSFARFNYMQDHLVQDINHVTCFEFEYSRWLKYQLYMYEFYVAI